MFTYAFRPLFLLATLFAMVSVPYWTGAWLGFYSLPVSSGGPVGWHAHEMIFGFAGAAVGGFALTAVATWTKRPPVAGTPLIALSAFWLSARILFMVPHPSTSILAAIADVTYGALLCLLMAREVGAAKNDRNYKVVLVLALLPLANVFFFVGLRLRAPWTMSALFAALWLVVLLINLIGGRIIPAFTRNWLRLQQSGRPEAGPLPPAFDAIDRIGSLLLIAFAIAHVMPAPPVWTAAIGAATGGMLLFRLYRWQGRRTLREPLVWVLHLGFAWIPVGVILLSAAELGLVPRTMGTHALTAGAMTTMIVAVAGRAALGHTGRMLRSHPLLTACYVLVTLAAICRVAAAAGQAERILLGVSAASWTLAFGCFAWRFVPILIQPPPQSRRPLPTV